MYFKLNGYHKENKLGYRNNRGTRRRRCIPVFPSFARRYVTLERCGIPRRISQAPRRLTFFSEPIPRRIMALSLWLAFPPLRRWQAPKPLHKLHEGEARAPSQSSTKRSPGHQPSQLGGHPPRVTSSRSLTRTNRGGELNTMQGCKARTPKVFKSLTLKSHQSNKC